MGVASSGPGSVLLLGSPPALSNRTDLLTLAHTVLLEPVRAHLSQLRWKDLSCSRLTDTHLPMPSFWCSVAAALQVPAQAVQRCLATCTSITWIN